MDSINDLIWKEEDENDIMKGRAINAGVGMIQTCQVNMASCSNEIGSSIDEWKNYYAGIRC